MSGGMVSHLLLGTASTAVRLMAKESKDSSELPSHAGTFDSAALKEMPLPACLFWETIAIDPRLVIYFIVPLILLLNVPFISATC